MEPNTLYYPYDPKFPAIEFVFVKVSDQRTQVAIWHTSDAFRRPLKETKCV